MSTAARPEKFRYIAEFEQPIAHLNPLQVRLPGPIRVQVFSVGTRGMRWKARALAPDGAPQKLLTFADGADLVSMTAEHCQRLVATLFETQLTAWQPVAE